MKKRLKNIPLNMLLSEIESIGEKKFRAQQIKQWLYLKRAGQFSQMRNLPAVLQQKLDSLYEIDKMVPIVILESRHGDAVKFGFKCIESKHLIESVLLIDGDRRTACISSQIGCALGCEFCQTGKMGFVRNLTQEEIIGQFIGINDYCESRGDKTLTNIVFMGMGEALSNYDNFMGALKIIMNDELYNIGARHITVSTAGVVPSVERLMREKMTIGLAISLNSYSNELRSTLMPINRRYPIESLIEVAKKYYHETGRRVTFEYVLIDGKTNTGEALDSLVRYLGNFPCKVNLIPVNPSGGNTFRGPDDSSLEKFCNELQRRGITATVRRSRGQDISGACGQLAGKEID